MTSSTIKKLHDSQKLDSFFHKISPYLIGFPIVIIIFAIVFKPSNLSVKKNTSPVAPTLSVQKSVSGAPLKSVTIDISKSYRCSQNGITAFIRNKRFSMSRVASPETTHLLYDGNCIYSWSGNSGNGSKTCGIGQFMSMALLNQNTVNAEKINLAAAMLGGKSSGMTVNKAVINSFLASCVADSSFTDSSFTVPKSVSFTETEL